MAMAKIKTPVVSNRQARRSYHILKKYEAGIVLKGSEVKSLRLGHGNLNNAFVVFTANRPYLLNMHIKRYKNNALALKPLDETRARALLMHKKEILQLQLNRKLENATIIPLKVYFTSSQRVKVMIALAKAIRKQDKRAVIKQREDERVMTRYKDYTL